FHKGPKVRPPQEFGRVCLRCLMTHKSMSSTKKAPRGRGGDRVLHCEVCGKTDEPSVGLRLKLCARCRGVSYCGMECQKAGWSKHRVVCAKLEKARLSRLSETSDSRRSGAKHNPAISSHHSNSNNADAPKPKLSLDVGKGARQSTPAISPPAQMSPLLMQKLQAMRSSPASPPPQMERLSMPRGISNDRTYHEITSTGEGYPDHVKPWRRKSLMSDLPTQQESNDGSGLVIHYHDQGRSIDRAPSNIPNFSSRFVPVGKRWPPSSIVSQHASMRGEGAPTRSDEVITAPEGQGGRRQTDGSSDTSRNTCSTDIEVWWGEQDRAAPRRETYYHPRGSTQNGAEAMRELRESPVAVSKETRKQHRRGRGFHGVQQWEREEGHTLERGRLGLRQRESLDSGERHEAPPPLPPPLTKLHQHMSGGHKVNSLPRENRGTRADTTELMETSAETIVVTPSFLPTVSSMPTRPPTLSAPGPRKSVTAMFYGRSPAGAGGVLPPATSTYVGRPEGFTVHVLVDSASCMVDLDQTGPNLSNSAPALLAARKERAGRPQSRGRLWAYYSHSEKGELSASLHPGDVVLLTPGRYNASSWGLQHLLCSVEIIGAGAAQDCVIHNYFGCKEHYLIGLFGGSGRDRNGEGAEGVRVRLANLTLEQGSGYRGTVYQLGEDSHCEMDGCMVTCSQSGLNIEQGSCLITDCTIRGSETFGVHIGNEGSVEHCFVHDCGGGGVIKGSDDNVETGGAGGSGEWDGGNVGTNVNGGGGFPAISILQRSRVQIRTTLVLENAGHAIQCRDSQVAGALKNEEDSLAARAQVEAEK
ncbi:unnamed protein product, partial [Choristocarpus tenellus]